MTDLRKVAQQALDAIHLWHWTGETHLLMSAHDALLTALEQPEQEPVAYVKGTYAGRLIYDTINPAVCLPVGMALYTTPPAAQRPWVGLTDEEVRDLWSWSMTLEAELTATTQQHAFARAIEAKLKEKNSG